jgi:hypothetical protein
MIFQLTYTNGHMWLLCHHTYFEPLVLEILKLNLLTYFHIIQDHTKRNIYCVDHQGWLCLHCLVQGW